MTADDIIEALNLSPHPEGGFYRETYRHLPREGGRGAGTAIYFLLRAGEHSHWHKVDATEIWHFYAGSPLELSTSSAPGEVKRRVLGPHLAKGELPQLLVEPEEWQSARSLGEFTLVGCTVSPAFEFEKFVLAPLGFEP